MKVSLLLVLSVTTLLACGDDTSSGGAGGDGGAGGSGAASTGGGSTGGGSTGGGGAGGGDTGGGDTGGAGGSAACIDSSGFEYGMGPNAEPECLTVATAASFCGFGSDDAICDFSVMCGISEDTGQCEINCEQGSSSFCNEPADVDCVISAYCANDCAALMACDFIL